MFVDLLLPDLKAMLIFCVSRACICLSNLILNRIPICLQSSGCPLLQRGDRGALLVKLCLPGLVGCIDLLFAHGCALFALGFALVSQNLTVNRRVEVLCHLLDLVDPEFIKIDRQGGFTRIEFIQRQRLNVRFRQIRFQRAAGRAAGQSASRKPDNRATGTAQQPDNCAGQRAKAAPLPGSHFQWLAHLDLVIEVFGDDDGIQQLDEIIVLEFLEHSQHGVRPG
jgi:hypothetical protein